MNLKNCRQNSRNGFFILGLSLSILPFLNSALIIWLAILICLVSKKINLRQIFNSTIIFFLFLVSVWGLSEIWNSFNQSWLDVTSQLNFRSLVAIALSGNLAFLKPLQEILKWWLLFILYFNLSNNFEDDKQFKEGFLIGYIFNLFFLTLQVLGILYIGNIDSYWIFQKRFSGVYTDPNALAMVSILGIPIIFEVIKNNTVAALVLTLEVTLLLFSGSRSYFLGIAIIMILFAAKQLFCTSANKKPLGIVVILGFTIKGTITSLLLLYTLKDNYHLPSGLTRVIEGLKVDKINDTLFNRSVFWQTGASIIKKNLTVGIGPGSFKDFFPYESEQLGFKLSLWTDNANSLYASILIEYGLIGFFLFLLLFFNYKFKKRIEVDNSGDKRSVLINDLYQITLISFLIISFFGAHINFYEVLLVFTIILASSVDFQEIKISKKYVLLLLPFVFLIFIKSSHKERGFYEWTYEDGKLARWSEISAKGYIDCEEKGKNKEIIFRNNSPKASQYPMTVRISQENQPVVIRYLNNNQKVSVPLTCDRKGRVEYRLESDRGWIPKIATNGVNNDSRLLGVQVFFEKLQSPLE